MCEHVSTGAHRDHERMSDLLELEFQAVVRYLIWVLRIELGSPTGADKWS